MYIKILKRDLRRNKAMNVILLVFIILASMFVSSSMSNIYAITGAVDDYFQRSGMTDLLVNTMPRGDCESVEDALAQLDAVRDYQSQRILYMVKDNLLINGKTAEEFNGTGGISSFEDAPLTLFDHKNQPIRQVASGTALIAPGVMETLNIQLGDTLELCYGKYTRAVEVTGIFKEASQCSTILMAAEDLEYLMQDQGDQAPMFSDLYYIHTDDPAAVTNALNTHDNVISVFNQAQMKTGYIMDMIVAGIILVVSICLILVAFVMLRFTIGFTLSEEFRQIGVLKAIGIPNTAIRGLYIAKYAVLALVGSAIGFAASIPFGSMLLESVSDSIVMEDYYGILTNIICSALVVVVTLLFCFGCTGKVRTLTPVNAIRRGTTGERFEKKGVLNLGKFPAKPGLFMAVNDVLSQPRRFGIVVVTFTLCLSLVLILVNSVNTLKSDKLVTAFGMTHTDLYMVKAPSELLTFFHEDGRNRAEAYLDEIEDTLQEHQMPAKCTMQVMFTIPVIYDGTEYKTTVFQGIGNHADEYKYYQGTPPQNPQEIALTGITAQRMGVQIGDTITLKTNDGNRAYIITALFQSMMYQGEGIQLHEDEDLSFLQLTGIYSTQIDFADNLSAKELTQRIPTLEKLLDTQDILTASEYVEEMAGVAETIDGIRRLVLAVALVVIALVTVLTAHSFIIKERGEIAAMKAIGIPSGTIIGWQTMRFGMVALLAGMIGVALQLPLTKLAIDPIFSMMGADFGVQYEIKPLQVFVIYPVVVLAVTMISGFFTALGTVRIQPRECSDVD